MSMQCRFSGRVMVEPRAIIDIGSNSIRLVIFDTPSRAPTVVYNEKCVAKLGKGVAEKGTLSAKAQATALAALGRFATLLKQSGIRNVTTVATAAVRDAANGPDFLEAVRKLGLKPRLLSGEEEAVFSATGVVGAFRNARGTVIDLGGGSIEMVQVRDKACEHGVSLPLGTLMLAALRAEKASKPAAAIAAGLRGADCNLPNGEALYLVGGTYRALARLAMIRCDWPLEDPHGFELSADDADRLCADILEKGLPRQVPGIPTSRLATIPDAAVVLKELLAFLRPAQVVFSSWGLREGLLFSGLDRSMQDQDPLLAGVMSFTASMGISANAASAVAGWTSDAAPPTSASRANLRLAATLLALAIQHVEPNLRERTALQWSLAKRWVGVSPSGRAMLATAILASIGRPNAPAQLSRLAGAEDIDEALAWGLATRLCRRFSHAAPQILSGSELLVHDGRLELHVENACAPLVTDMVQKDLKALAGKLRLDAAVVLD